MIGLDLDSACLGTAERYWRQLTHKLHTEKVPVCQQTQTQNLAVSVSQRVLLSAIKVSHDLNINTPVPGRLQMYKTYPMKQHPEDLGVIKTLQK